MYLLDKIAAVSLIVIAVLFLVFTGLHISGKLKFAQVNYVTKNYIMPTPIASPSASLISPSPVKTLYRTSVPTRSSVVTVSPKK